MDRITTLSRQFGSGGHEIAKRLSKRLDLPFYDKNILRIVEEKTHYSEAYLLENEEQVPSLLNGPFYGSGHTSFYPQISTDKVFFSISHVLKDIAAKGPCIIVGRCSDYVLHEFNPLNFFVYASMESKIERKLSLLKENNEPMISAEEMKKQIRYVDKQRAKYYEFYTDRKWGQPTNYHLCLNTSDLSIDQAVDVLAYYINSVQ